MGNEWNEQDREPQSERQDQQASGQQSQQNEFGQQGQQSESERQHSSQQPFNAPETMGNRGSESSDTGFESSDTMTDTDSVQGSLGEVSEESDSGRSGRESGGFIGSQGSNSDDYVQRGENPELSGEDSLNQQDDDGMGSPGSEQSDRNF